MLAAVTLLAVIGTGATLAYFTDKAETVNIVTMGHVDITIEEPHYEGKDNDNTVEDIVPGETIAKDPTITVQEGSADAYVRAVLTIEGLDEEMKQELLEGINIYQGWYYNEADGYYYYNTRLTAGDSAVLFDTVMIPEKWGNEAADKSFQIIVSAEAIQADNFEPQYNADNSYIMTWLDKEGNTITAENYDGGVASVSGAN